MISTETSFWSSGCIPQPCKVFIQIDCGKNFNNINENKSDYEELLKKCNKQEMTLNSLKIELCDLRKQSDEKNEYLWNMLKVKQINEQKLLKDIENLKGENEKYISERERLIDEKQISEQIVKKLNEKLSVKIKLS